MDRSVVYSDILEQALTLPRMVDMLDALRMPELAVRPGASFVFTGCGSSYHTAQSAAQLMRGLYDASAYAVPGSEVWLLPALWLKEGSVLIAISRTGTTTEVLRAMERAHELGVPTIGVSLRRDVPNSVRFLDKKSAPHINLHSVDIELLAIG